MFSKSIWHRSIADIFAAIKAGKHTEALAQLNEKKRLRLRVENIDYCRALCFLAGAKDAMHARQALLEELRYFPNNTSAQTLLDEVNEKVRPFLLPPKELMKSDPLFAVLCDALLDYTMLSWKRLYNLYQLSKQVCNNNNNNNNKEAVFMECGVAGGGSVILLAVIAAHFSKFPIKVYALDTFNGMPEPTILDALDNGQTPANSTYWGTGTCSAREENIKRLAKDFGVEEHLIIVPGMFQDTLPKVLNNILNKEKYDGGIALLHVDADWYESTKSALTLAWPAVQSRGGVVQVDDYYYWNGCQKAVDEFIKEQNNNNNAEQKIKLQPVDGNAVYFLKY